MTQARRARKKPPDAAVLLVTAPNEALAQKLAITLVNEKLIACANLVPRVRSIYRWQGEVCDDAEVLLVIKTRASRFDRVRRRIVELHSYEVPEVLRLEVTAGHQPYLAWLKAAVD